jgi:hypothetical protein
LFSPCNSNLSNVNHDDDVMFLYESNPTLETNLPIIPSKLTIQKKNFDALKKKSRFLHCKTTMGRIVFRLKIATYTLSSARSIVRWRGRIKYMLLSGI